MQCNIVSPFRSLCIELRVVIFEIENQNLNGEFAELQKRTLSMIGESLGAGSARNYSTAACSTIGFTLISNFEIP